MAILLLFAFYYPQQKASLKSSTQKVEAPTTIKNPAELQKKSKVFKKNEFKVVSDWATVSGGYFFTKLKDSLEKIGTVDRITFNKIRNSCIVDGHEHWEAQLSVHKVLQDDKRYSILLDTYQRSFWFWYKKSETHYIKGDFDYVGK